MHQAKIFAENIIKTVPGPTRMSMTCDRHQVSFLAGNAQFNTENHSQNYQSRRKLCFVKKVEGAGKNAFTCIFGCPYPATSPPKQISKCKL